MASAIGILVNGETTNKHFSDTNISDIMIQSFYKHAFLIKKENPKSMVVLCVFHEDGSDSIIEF